MSRVVLGACAIALFTLATVSVTVAADPTPPPAPTDDEKKGDKGGK